MLNLVNMIFTNATGGQRYLSSNLTTHENAVLCYSDLSWDILLFQLRYKNMNLPYPDETQVCVYFRPCLKQCRSK